MTGTLLRRFYPEPEVNLALELFLRLAHGFLGPRLASVLLYGSICFDDLAPGYGDLDFLAVVAGPLSAADQEALLRLRTPLRSGPFGVYASMIEGAFLPSELLDETVRGAAVWWGTSSERLWDRNDLGALVMHVIGERGQVIYGEDIRARLPVIPTERMTENVRAFAASLCEQAKPGELHSVDWLLSAARLILWLREGGRLSSKSEAADWGAVHLRGAWRAQLPRCKELRKAPALAEREDSRLWLAGLGPAFAEAHEELAAELTSRR